MMQRLLAIILSVFCLSIVAQAEEKITSFQSDVTVNKDASLDVVETISVISEDMEIRHGIFRDFPTNYVDKNGLGIRVDFSVQDVTRENYVIESISNGKRVKIGDKDVFLKFGKHTYVIKYHTTRQLGFFDTFDELYWNVTGNGWAFPIEQSGITIHLPSGAEIQKNSVYTGANGDTGHDADVTVAEGNEYQANATRVLQPGEGLTVAVAWQKGIVAAPTAQQKQMWMLRDNAGFLGMGLTLLSVAGYFFYAWSKVGRDPPKGTIIPLFHPPENMGPAGVRYVWKQGSDDRAIAAALVGLAVKGRLKIEDNDGVYTIHKIAEGGAPMVASETVLFDRLPSGSLDLKQSNNLKIRVAMDAAKKSLAADYNGKLFAKNYGWFVGGLAMSLVGLFISSFLMPDNLGVVWLFVGGVCSVAWGFVMIIGGGLIKGVFTGYGFFTKLKNLIALVCLAPFFAGGIAGPFALIMKENISPAVIVFIAAMMGIGLLNLLFFYLMPAPTVQGQRVLDDIEGFKLYMTTAEEKRLDMLNPPEKTPALFERYLPYAMALDCENAWNAKFATVLAAAAAAGAAGATWYYGTGNRGWGGMSDSLGRGLSSTLSTSSTAPGSSSGSSGGGSSGGGGGGGGGGGW
jgi:Predicted membrane protein (DUF2207)